MTEDTNEPTKRKRSAPMSYAEQQQALRDKGMKELEKVKAREAKAQEALHVVRRERVALEEALGLREPPKPESVDIAAPRANGHVAGF